MKPIRRREREKENRCCMFKIKEVWRLSITFLKKNLKIAEKKRNKLQIHSYGVGQHIDGGVDVNGGGATQNMR